MMLSLTVFGRRFTPHWGFSLLAFLFVLLFLRLGFWQLMRADEKKQMQTKEQSYASLAPTKWSPENKNPANYERIQLVGDFKYPTLLLDNQHHNHQFGYHVITPLQLSNNKVVLVDRGWILGDKRRKQFPMIKNPEGQITITGYAYYPSTQRIILGQMLDKEMDKLAIIEWIDTQDISHFLHKSVYPFIIRLDEKEAHGFIREWPVVSMPPERHVAYASQWFAMAFVIFILYIALNLKKKYEK